MWTMQLCENVKREWAHENGLCYLFLANRNGYSKFKSQAIQTELHCTPESILNSAICLCFQFIKWIGFHMIALNLEMNWFLVRFLTFSIRKQTKLPITSQPNGKDPFVSWWIHAFLSKTLRLNTSGMFNAWVALEFCTGIVSSSFFLQQHSLLITRNTSFFILNQLT